MAYRERVDVGRFWSADLACSHASNIHDAAAAAPVRTSWFTFNGYRIVQADENALWIFFFLVLFALLHRRERAVLMILFWLKVMYVHCGLALNLIIFSWNWFITKVAYIFFCDLNMCCEHWFDRSSSCYKKVNAFTILAATISITWDQEFMCRRSNTVYRHITQIESLFG